jgi:cytochrome c553
MPPPVAATNTPLPPPPTEVPTSTPLPTPADVPLEATPTEVPTNTPLPSNTPPPPPTEVPSTSEPSSEAAEKPSAELAEAANQIYAANSCLACHGANYEGGLGPILVGLPAEYLQSKTRSGDPERGMAAFDQDDISDEDLSVLAEFLSRLTLKDIDVELPPSVADHLSQARSALQADDQAAVETHLRKAQEAGADTSPGVQASLRGLVEDMGEVDWLDVTKARLKVLLGQ